MVKRQEDCDWRIGAADMSIRHAIPGRDLGYQSWVDGQGHLMVAGVSEMLFIDYKGSEDIDSPDFAESIFSGTFFDDVAPLVGMGMTPMEPVGGELIPIDTTMVLLGATDTTTLYYWLIPVIVAGSVVAIVVARKF